MKNRLLNHGFTIVELITIIAIIAILAAVSVFSYNGVSKSSQDSSLKTDLREMDVAQKAYMLKNSSSALPTNPDGSINDVLVFSSNPGNTIIVKLIEGSRDYCIYGYNPKSNHPDPSRAIVRQSGSSSCPTLTQEEDEEISGPSGVRSTVAIIGERLEVFKEANGRYPNLSELKNIGLTIKPNAGNANQQQLYCRNNNIALYLQVDKSQDVVYAYQTMPIGGISEPQNLPKLSLNNVCPLFGISPGQPGYESTGIKNPDV